MKLTVRCNSCGEVIVNVTGDRKIIVAEQVPFWCSKCGHHCGQTSDPFPFEIRVRA